MKSGILGKNKKKKNKQKKNKPQEEIGLGSKKDCTQHQIIFFLLTLVLDSKQNKPAIGWSWLSGKTTIEIICSILFAVFGPSVSISNISVLTSLQRMVNMNVDLELW